MSEDSDPIDRLVRRAATVHDDELARSWSHSRAEQALFEEITMRIVEGQARPLRTPDTLAAPDGGRPRGPVRWAVAASVVVAASLGLFAAFGAGPTVDSAAAGVLRAASAAAATGTGPGVLAEGQYWYDHTEGRSSIEGDTGPAEQQTWSCETWIARDGSGRGECSEDGRAAEVTEWAAQVPAPAGDSEALAVVAGSDGAFTTGRGSGTYQDLIELPTDPDALSAYFEQELADYDDRPRNIAMFVVVTDVLRQPAPPALRSALFEVASRIPGVQLVGEVTDQLGRTGVAVAMDDETGTLRDEVVIDTVTSALLAERRTLRTAVDWIDLEPGGVVSESVILASGIVDGPNARP